MNTKEQWCTDCHRVHGERYATFSEWSWHFPAYEEIGRRSLGELTPDRAAGLAWRYQQETIDALRADMAAAQPFLLHAAAWMSWPDVPMPLTFAAKSIQEIVSAMHNGLHDAVADIARATTRAENAEADLERLCGPVMTCCGHRAFQHEYKEEWMQIGRDEAYAVGLVGCPDSEAWIEATAEFMKWEQNQ